MKSRINIAIACTLAFSVLWLIYIIMTNRSTVPKQAMVAYIPPSTGSGQIIPYPPPSLTPGPIRTLQPTRVPPSPIAVSTATPLPPPLGADTEDSRQVIAVIELGYELKSRAARTFDTSAFDTAYVDDASTDLTAEQSAFVQRVIPFIKDRLPLNMSKPGLLTYWKVQYAYWQLGAERLERQRLGTPVSPQDGPIGPPRRTDAVLKADLRFDNIRVYGDRAEVVLDDGLALRRFHLVKLTEGWRITQEIALEVHF